MAVHKRPLYLFCYTHPLIHFIHSMTASLLLLQSPALASTIRWSVPPLRSCVFIKHHNYFATRPEVGPYFPPGMSLWNCSLFYGRICRAGLLSRFSVLCYLDWSRLLFFHLKFVSLSAFISYRTSPSCVLYPLQ